MTLFPDVTSIPGPHSLSIEDRLRRAEAIARAETLAAAKAAAEAKAYNPPWPVEYDYKAAEAEALPDLVLTSTPEEKRLWRFTTRGKQYLYDCFYPSRDTSHRIFRGRIVNPWLPGMKADDAIIGFIEQLVPLRASGAVKIERESVLVRVRERILGLVGCRLTQSELGLT